MYLEVPQLSLVTANFKGSRLLLAKIEHPLTKTQLSHLYKHARSVETVWIQQMILHAAQKYTWVEQLLFPGMATKMASYIALHLKKTNKNVYFSCSGQSQEQQDLIVTKKLSENLSECSEHPTTCIQTFDNFAEASCCAFYTAQLYPMDPASLHAEKCLVPHYLHVPLLMQIPVLG